MWFVLACVAADPPSPDPAPAAAPEDTLPGGGLLDEADESDAVFDPDHLHDITLTLPPADWADLDGNPWAETWHTADFAWDGEAVAQVGVRAFGYSSHVAGKPPLKLDFDRVVPGRVWRGLESLKLKNGYYDPSLLHEALEPWMLRRAGVPASRTGWARVWANGDFVGVYVVMEPIDDRFLTRNFGNDDGPLWSIDGIRGHGLMPLTDPLAYFQTNTSVESDGAELVELTRIVAEGTDAELAATLDTDTFFVESIVRTLAGSQDSFSADGNNFYLYDDPEGRWAIVPWDYNFDFTAFGLTAPLRVDPARPWATSDYAYDPYTGAPYTDVLMARQVADGRSVADTIEALAAEALAYDTIAAQVAAWHTLLTDDAALDPIAAGDDFTRATADDLLYLHLRLSNELGREVASCAPMEEGSVPVRSMSPAGSVGWSRLTADGWWWDDGSGNGCVTRASACIGFQVAQTHYCTGLFAHAPSSVSIEVPAGMAELRGAVGLQGFAQDCSTGASFRIRQGGAVVWQSDTLTSYSEAAPFTVPILPGQVVLETDPLGDYACDTTAWLDLRAVP